jgi:hypothetical protein
MSGWQPGEEELIDFLTAIQYLLGVERWYDGIPYEDIERCLAMFSELSMLGE